ncbi:hypothetical protein, partial [Anaerococcus tetradius]
SGKAPQVKPDVKRPSESGKTPQAKPETKKPEQEKQKPENPKENSNQKERKAKKPISPEKKLALAKLKKAHEENKIINKALRMLIEKYPNIIRSVRGKVLNWLAKSNTQLERAEKILAEYE